MSFPRTKTVDELRNILLDHENAYQVELDRLSRASEKTVNFIKETVKNDRSHTWVKDSELFKNEQILSVFFKCSVCGMQVERNGTLFIGYCHSFQWKVDGNYVNTYISERLLRIPSCSEMIMQKALQ